MKIINHNKIIPIIMFIIMFFGIITFGIKDYKYNIQIKDLEKQLETINDSYELEIQYSYSIGKLQTHLIYWKNYETVDKQDFNEQVHIFNEISSKLKSTYIKNNYTDEADTVQEVISFVDYFYNNVSKTYN